MDAIAAAATPASATSARLRTGRVNGEISMSAGVRAMERANNVETQRGVDLATDGLPIGLTASGKATAAAPSESAAGPSIVAMAVRPLNMGRRGFTKDGPLTDKGSRPPASTRGIVAGCSSEEIVTESGVPVPAVGVASGERMEAARAGPVSSRSFAAAAMAVYATGATRCKLTLRD